MVRPSNGNDVSANSSRIEAAENGFVNPLGKKREPGYR